MKEKRLVKKDPEMPVLTPIIPDEKLLNNNTKRDLDVGSSSYLNASKEPCCGSINEDCHTDENNVAENNNDIENAREDAVIDEFVSLKKKVKLKKKYKASIHEFENAIGNDDALSKKKKKKKKDKKEKKEKDRFSFDKIMKDKEKKLKEKKDRKKEKIKKPKKEKNSPKETFINPSDDESTFPKTSPSKNVSVTQIDFGDLPSCELTSDDLRDGLRVLLRLGGHFHTSRVTEISPPDIYGVVVDKERGNKPHILSREEVLQQAVRDVKPRGAFDLPVGARVCAYWSSQLSYLHPGRVSAPDTDDAYVVIQLDDGDSRDIHYSQVRCLPQDYPVIESEESIISASIGSRKRGSTGSENNLEIPKPAKKPRSEPTKHEKKHASKENKHSKKHKEHKEKKRKQKTTGWSVSVTEISEEKIEEKPVSDVDHDITKETEQNGDDDKIYEDDVTLPSDRRQGSNNKSPIAAFLPPQHTLWRWADAGHRQNSKSRRLFHKSIRKDDMDSLEVGDCAVFLSTSRPDRPYIGRIHSLWQTSGGNMKVQVRWFYHPAEVEGSAEGGGRVEDLKIQTNALFASSHADENDIQTISHKCQLLDYNEYVKLVDAGRDDLEDIFYLAGDYDPVVGTIKFCPDVIR